jgi:hypothetical protein
MNTDEWNRALLQQMLAQGDLGAEEDVLEKQLALSQSLRPNAQRMDWASQASRAIAGGAQGYGAKQYREGQQALGKKRVGIIEGMRGALGGTGQPEQLGYTEEELQRMKGY